MGKAAMIGIALAGVAWPATSQVTSAATAVEKGSKVRAPTARGSRIVCEVEEQIGTRLGGRRICLTVDQWADQRREHREGLERIQRTPNQSPSQ